MGGFSDQPLSSKSLIYLTFFKNSSMLSCDVALKLETGAKGSLIMQYWGEIYTE